jgi:hypothetical protein
MGALSRASARRAKTTKPPAPTRKITGMLKHHLIHLHVMQSGIMRAPAPHTQFGTHSFLLRTYRRNRSSRCLAVTISVKFLISP